jgi:hypothetical protein
MRGASWKRIFVERPHCPYIIGIALASPLTVRVVLALAPLVVFALQWAEGRLPPSPYSLATAGLYGGCAIAAAWREVRRSRPDGKLSRHD